MSYPPCNCACGRSFGSNVFRQHARKCDEMLREWAKDPRVAVWLLDERSDARKAAAPIGEQPDRFTVEPSPQTPTPPSATLPR